MIGTALADGTYRYGGENGIAILKEGDTVRIYDYATRTPSRPLSVKEASNALQQYHKASEGRRDAIKYPSYSESDIRENMETLAGMNPVAAVDASKLERTGKPPKEMFADYFSSLGGALYSEEFGDIALSNSSVKSEIRHGLTAEKIASMEAIPSVIEKGRVIFYEKRPGTDVDRIVVAAPIEIGPTEYYMGVMLQRDTTHQRLYLHNVAAIKTEEANQPSQDDSHTNWSDEGDSLLLITSILKNAIDVKLKIQKNSSNRKDALPEDIDAVENEAVEQNSEAESAGDSTFSHEHLSEETKKRSISVGMTESERAEILREKKISPKAITVKDAAFNWDDLKNNRKKEVGKFLVRKMRDLGHLRTYKTDAIDVEFEFTGGGLRKSMNSQVGEYGGTLADLAKVVMNMQTILDSSVLIEIHKDKAKGTSKENQRLVQTYVLMSTYAERKSITPVQFEVKQYVDDQNRLYLAVALTKIEADVMGDTVLREEERTRLLSPSTYSIPQLIEKINPRDETFFKYIPDVFLSADQKAAKERALVREAKKYGKEVKAALPEDGGAAASTATLKRRLRNSRPRTAATSHPTR